jgi:hypothetical protein
VTPYVTRHVDLGDADWLKNVNFANGVLSVTIDLSGHAAELNPKSASAGLCKPTSFCSFQNGACACNASADDHPLVSTDPTFKAECDAVCDAWAVKDLDCPPVLTNGGKYVSGRCFGFT